jgi:hypothetical protein
MLGRETKSLLEASHDKFSVKVVEAAVEVFREVRDSLPKQVEHNLYRIRDSARSIRAHAFPHLKTHYNSGYRGFAALTYWADIPRLFERMLKSPFRCFAGYGCISSQVESSG